MNVSPRKHVVQDLAFYAFPSLEQLQEATDEGLRAAGFGYRCSTLPSHVES